MPAQDPRDSLAAGADRTCKWREWPFRHYCHSSDPETAAKGFARLFADGKAGAQDGGWKVSTGARSADIWVVTGEKAAALYPGVNFAQTPGKAFAALRIRVASLDKARGVLEANGVSHVTTPAGIAVLPENASGTVLEFSEQ